MSVLEFPLHIFKPFSLRILLKFLIFLFLAISMFSCKSKDIKKEVTPQDLADQRVEEKKTDSEEIVLEYPDNYRKWGYVGLHLRKLTSQKFVITDVKRNTPARIVGMRPGDYLIDIDGIRIYSLEQYRSIIRNSAIGSRVSFRMERDGKKYIENLLVITFPQDHQFYLWAKNHLSNKRTVLAKQYFDFLRLKFPHSSYIKQIPDSIGETRIKK